MSRNRVDVGKYRTTLNIKEIMDEFPEMFYVGGDMYQINKFVNDFINDDIIQPTKKLLKDLPDDISFEITLSSSANEFIRILDLFLNNVISSDIIRELEKSESKFNMETITYYFIEQTRVIPIIGSIKYRLYNFRHSSSIKEHLYYIFKKYDKYGNKINS